MHDELSPTCGRVQNELAAFLYGELAPDSRAALEQHLEDCGPCREELAALRETQRLLSRWETPAVSDDPRQLARAIAAQAGGAGVPRIVATGAPASARARLLGNGRLVRWSALVFGAAAALLFALSLLNARASLEGGRLQLDFALPGARATAPVASSAVPYDEMRAFVAQEVAARSANLEQSQEEFFQRCSQMTQQDLLRLSQAVDYALAQNQRTYDARLTTLVREAARADLETRQVLTNLASYLPDPNRSNR